MSVFLAPQRIRRAVAVAACTVLSTMAAPALGELPGTLITAPLATRDTPIAPTWISVLGATDYEYEFYAGACSAVDLGSPTGTVPAPTTTVNLTPAADGLYCIRVRGVQLGLGLIVVDAGPWAQASVTFDTVPPTAPVITGGQPASQPWLTATFSLATSEPAAKFNWNFGSSQVSNGATAVQNLDAPTGPYTFTVTAKDPAGNVSPASVRVFGLQAPPAPTITSGPPAGSHLVGPPTFTLDGVSGSIRRWSFNPGGAQGVSNTATLSNATETGYTLSATQAFGPRVSAPVTRNFTISSAPPAVGGGVPDGTATKLIPSFGLSGAGSGETYQWVLDGPTAVTGNSSGVDLGQIADGDYTLKARIADSIGNSTAYVTRTFTLDRQKPTVPAVTPDIIAIVNKPPAGTIGGGGEPIISSRWQVDDAAVQVGPSFSTVGLPDGNHTLKAWVTDRAGNESEPLVRAFKLDRLAPNPPDIGPVPGFTNRVPVVTITSVAGQKIQWTLTGPKTLQGEGLSPLQPNFGPLTDGDYTLSATTTSPAGNLSGRTA